MYAVYTGDREREREIYLLFDMFFLVDAELSPFLSLMLFFIALDLEAPINGSTLM